MLIRIVCVFVQKAIPGSRDAVEHEKEHEEVSNPLRKCVPVGDRLRNYWNLPVAIIASSKRKGLLIVSFVIAILCGTWPLINLGYNILVLLQVLDICLSVLHHINYITKKWCLRKL